MRKHYISWHQRRVWLQAQCNLKKKKNKKINVHVNIWTNWIIHTWLVMLRQRPTVENTTKQTEFCVLNMSLNLFAFSQYLQVICSFNLTCTLQQSMQRHHYIQTSCLCDSAWSCHHMYSYNMLTYTIYISPWTKSCVTAHSPHMVQNHHSATLGVMSDLVFIKQRHYSTETTCPVTTKASNDF